MGGAKLPHFVSIHYHKRRRKTIVIAADKLTAHANDKQQKPSDRFARSHAYFP